MAAANSASLFLYALSCWATTRSCSEVNEPLSATSLGPLKYMSKLPDPRRSLVSFTNASLISSEFIREL